MPLPLNPPELKPLHPPPEPGSGGYPSGLVDGGGRPRALIAGKGQRRVGLAGQGWVGTHQSWLGGRGFRGYASGLVDGGGRPRALILALGQGWVGQGGGARAREGCKGFGSGGVGGRDTGPRDGAVCRIFFEGCPVGVKKKNGLGWSVGGGGTHRSWPGGRGG